MTLSHYLHCNEVEALCTAGWNFIPGTLLKQDVEQFTLL
jgi:hypothetical protein